MENFELLAFCNMLFEGAFTVNGLLQCTLMYMDCNHDNEINFTLTGLVHVSK